MLASILLLAFVGALFGGAAGAVVGAIAGVPVAMLVALVRSGARKPCPQCGRRVRRAALRCRHCGHEFARATLVAKGGNGEG